VTDHSHRDNSHHGTVFGAFAESEVHPYIDTSYQFRPQSAYYLEFNNIDYGLSPRNGFTFATWVYDMGGGL